MIISNVIGGLGNQMFQYACGRALSLDCDQELRLFLGDFSGYTLHSGFTLPGVFSGDFPIADSNTLRALIGWRAPQVARRALRHPALASLRGKGFVVDPESTIESDLAASLPRRGGFLFGYWQSERYFERHARQLRRDLDWRQPLEGRNATFAKLMRKGRSVSIHVRRGDYASNPAVLAKHGVCPIEYYLRAVKALTEDGRQRNWYLFSDDVAWVREHLAPHLDGEVHVIDHNQRADSHFDMQLMSLCDDHIIANSSFSWWGAWLSSSLDQRVIAPQRWFANFVETTDRCPPSWLRL